VGPRTAPYGRFARGFHAASGRTAMSFVLDARLWGGLPLPAARGVALALRLVYFDAGGGVLTLAYDAAGGCTAAATVSVAPAAVVVTPWERVPVADAPIAPGTWAEVTINITDAYFGRRCGPRGADIVLSSTADSIVHGFEVYRTGGGGDGDSGGGGAPTASPTASATPPASPTATVSRASATGTGAASASATGTAASSATATRSATGTGTASATAASSATGTAASQPSSSTPSRLSSKTGTASSSKRAVAPLTPTSSRTRSRAATRTRTRTATRTRTRTATRSKSRSRKAKRRAA
jgi:hypothetical protein